MNHVLHITGEGPIIITITITNIIITITMTTIIRMIIPI